MGDIQKKKHEIFFEYEKTDTLEEFILNFEPFIKDYDNQIEIIKDLIVMFKRENDSVEHKRNENLEEEQLRQVHNRVRKNKQIITYLKGKLDDVEKNSPKEVKPRKTNKIVVTTIKKQKRRHHKPKKSFSDETLMLAIKIENGYKLDKLTTEELVEMLKYYQYKKDNAIQKKNVIQSREDRTGLDEAYQEIKRCTEIFDKLIIQKKENSKNYPEESKKGISTFKLPFSIEQLYSLDEYLGINNGEILESINVLNNNEDFVKLNQLYESYVSNKKILLKRKNDLCMRRRKLKNIGDETLINEIEDAIKVNNIHMDILNNLLNYLKYYQKNDSHSKKVNALLFANEIEITDTQEIIEKQILKESNLDGYELKDILYGLGHYVKYDGVIDLKLLETVKHIFNQCLELTISDELELNAIHYIWDAIKYRLMHTDKEDTKSREILKDVRILFDYIIKNYKEDNTKFKHDYHFNVVAHFLKHEDNYLYMKKLVEAVPNIVNTRYVTEINGEKRSEHIIMYILENFINNYKKMIRDSKSSYISKDYLKSVYLLFIRNYRIYLTTEEKRQIDRTLSDFMKEVNIVLTSSRRKNAVKNDLKDMYTHRMYMNRRDDILHDINDHKLEYQMNGMFMNINNSIQSSKRTDLIDECSFLVGSGYHAYSVSKIEDKTILKIHVIDLYDIFTRNSELEKYLYNETIQGEELDSYILGRLSMVKHHQYPTITYEIEFDDKGNYKRKNGHIDNFRVYQSKIEPKAYYSDFNLVYTKGDVVLKSFLDLYRISLIKNHGSYNNSHSMADVESYFEGIVNQGVSEYFKLNNLPFIYSGTKNKNEQETIRLMNELSHILSRLDPDEFKKIYSILDGDADEFHYSVKAFDGDYQLFIQNPVHIAGLLIQRVLHELVFDNRHNEEEYDKAVKKFRDEMKKIVMELNYYNRYVDVDVLKENKGKIKKRDKILL